MSITTVAVFGASSPAGQAQVRKLLELGYAVRAAIRPGERVPGVGSANLRAFSVDYDDMASLARICSDVDTVFFQPPLLFQPPRSGGGDRLRQRCGNVARAARHADVDRFVLNSTMWAPDNPCGSALFDQVLEIENLFSSEQLPLVVFRPTVYMENLLTPWTKVSIVSESKYAYGQKPGLEMDPVCTEDLASFMIEGARSGDFLGKRLCIGGPQRLTPPDYAATLSKVLCKTIKYEFVPVRQFGYRVYEFIGASLDTDVNTFVDFFDEFYSFINDSPYKPFCCDAPHVLGNIPIERTTLHAWASKQDWGLTGGAEKTSTTRC